MFKRGSYNVKKAEKKSSSSESKPEPAAVVKPKQPSKPSSSSSSSSSNTNSSTMTLKKKANIKSVSNKQSPEYRRSNSTNSTKWVENKTFNKK